MNLIVNSITFIVLISKRIVMAVDQLFGNFNDLVATEVGLFS